MMAKRTPGLEKTESIVRKTIHDMGKAAELKFLSHSVFWHWAEIVGRTNARYVKPQGIRKGILYLYTDNAVLRNELQLRQLQVIENANSCIGRSLLKGIAFTRKWEKPESEGIDEIRFATLERENNPAGERKAMSLSKEETEFAESIGKKAKDEELGQVVRALICHQIQRNKVQLTKNWHSCASCGTLCEPQETYCAVCARKQKEALRGEIRQVLADIPWARCPEVQKYVPACTLKLLNDIRSEMVQQLAAQIDVRDTESLKAKQLVMLFRCLPPEQLTEDVIKRTMYQLRYSLCRPDGYVFPKRYSVISLGKKKKGESV